VYADDNVRHVGNVFSSAVDRNLDVASFHFTHEETRVQKFNYSDKSEVNAGWKAIQREMAGDMVATSSPKPSPRKVVVRRGRYKARCR
jgi:hypothetical protein